MRAFFCVHTPRDYGFWGVLWWVFRRLEVAGSEKLKIWKAEILVGRVGILGLKGCVVLIMSEGHSILLIIEVDQPIGADQYGELLFYVLRDYTPEP